MIKVQRSLYIRFWLNFQKVVTVTIIANGKDYRITVRQLKLKKI